VSDDVELSRRKALAAIGSVGLVGFVGVAGIPPSRTVEYNRLTYAQSEEPGLDLRVDWAEYYNGHRLQQQDELADNADDEPTVTLRNVLPGDHGRLAFGLAAEPDSEVAAEAVVVEMRLRLFVDDENGRMEPEARAGDSPDDPDDQFDGELGEYIDVVTWYDTGLEVGETPIYGGCDGTYNSFGEGRVDALSGSFRDAASGSWVTIAGPDAPEGCLNVQQEQALCLGFQWEAPGGAADGDSDHSDLNDNVIQSDRLEFGIDFRVEGCQP
jgi:hypothetical protein